MNAILPKAFGSACTPVTFQPVSSRKVRTELARSGYARLDSRFVAGQDGTDLARARAAFLRSTRKNPVDPHSDKKGRHRRYGVFVLHPWSGVLESIPPVWDEKQKEKVARYLQSSRINPEQGGLARGFAPLTKSQSANLFLRSTILRCFDALPWAWPGQPVIVGVHVIQLIAKDGAPAISSPDALHRDGEPFTCAFLLDRQDVTGGENIIAIPEVANRHPSEVAKRDILARFTLETPFEGWVVNDRKVSHYVSPVVVGSGHQTGSRTILLIDFTPAVPDVEK